MPLAISKHLEAQVAAQGDAAVVFAAFQHARHLSPRTAARYERLAAQAAFVAQDLGDEDCADSDRRFDFCPTYDRDLAIEAVRGLLARIAPR